jgi:Uma2 family endonuclease
MDLMVLDPDVRKRLIAQRRACGGDRFDEVWEGVYMMAPLANDEHQDLQTGLVVALHWVVQRPGLGLVRAGVNVSDREKGWKSNYRCPDVVVFLTGTSARNCDTHWLGGPDLAVEIVSPRDRSREKVDFYTRVGVRELLVIDRKPWALELYRLGPTGLTSVGTSDPAKPASLASSVVPLSFRLAPGAPRPRVELHHRDGLQKWDV